jgi:N-acetylmuramic acid 6-phosphate etherase
MKTNCETAAAKAQHFLDCEKPFHLGFLPTEQSNPQTEHLDELFQKDIQSGVRNLQLVDANIVEMSERIFASPQYSDLRTSMGQAISRGHHVVLSGCGATGRLSIMLETMWRKYCQSAGEKRWEDSVRSIMTGGDYALVRSVESFEDYAEIGRQQVREMRMCDGDVLIAITEGGETSSVLGTVDQALQAGAKVFLMFNNPASLLASHIERSRRVIENPAVTVLDLYCGPMAVAGSTRMQATTSELLVAGKALQDTLGALYHQPSDPSEFKRLLGSLASDPCVQSMADVISLEQEIYSTGGLVTYFADELLLDIFTDTTERTPTFAIPPFRKNDDSDSPPSWAFVKNPGCDTIAAWGKVLARAPNCLEWDKTFYQTLRGGEKIAASPPAISKTELYKFSIGCERDASRFRTPSMAAVVRLASEPLRVDTKAFDRTIEVVIGQVGEPAKEGVVSIPVTIPTSPLGLYHRLAVKLLLNTISTGTMVRMGRVKGNWMTHVVASNKKLVDRAVRLISGLCGIPYAQACHELFKSIDILDKWQATQGERPSPVAFTIEMLQAGQGGNITKRKVKC